MRNWHPWFLVQFIRIGLWQSCYINILVPDLAPSAILLELSQIIRMLILESLTLHYLSTIPLPLSSLLITSNFSSILIVFHQFFTWIPLGYIDLHFSLILVTKPMLLKGELYQTCDYITNVINPYTTDSMIMISLSASLQHKTRTATDHACQIVLNWKILHIIYAKSC